MKLSACLRTRFPLPVVCGALLAALTAAPCAHAQTPITTWAQSYGAGSYDANGQPVTQDFYGSGNDTPVGIAPMPDGGVVVAGKLDLPKFKSSYAGDHAPAALVRYGKDGTILWQSVLRQDNDAPDYNGTLQIAISHVIGVCTDAAGNIFVAGGEGNVDNGGQLPFVAKFSPDGALLWRNGVTALDFLLPDQNGKPMIFPEGIAAFSTMDSTADGGVVVGSSAGVAQDYNNVSGHTVPTIVKFNADGSVGFHREYEFTAQYSSVISVCSRPGGTGYALLLQPDSSNSANNGTSVVVMLTDGAGNPVSQRTFSGDAYGGSPQSIRASADGGLLFLSGISGGSQVHKLNADGSLVWQTQVHNFDSTYSNSLTPTADGGCIIGGQLTLNALGISPDGYAKTLLCTLDGAGTLKSAHLLGGSKGEGAPLTCQTTDGALAFTTATLSYNTEQLFPDWWVVKADANGKVIRFGETMIDPPLDFFAAGPGEEPPSFVSGDYGSAPAGEADPSLVLGGPGLILENLASETGLDQPSVKVQATPATSYNHPVFFGGEAYLGQGAYYLKFSSGSPFGYYGYLADSNYIFHEDLGYEYVFDANDQGHGVFLYDFTTKGFFYTSPAFAFPYLYDFKENSVVYYYPDPSSPGRYNTDGFRFFYVFNTGQIISK